MSARRNARAFGDAVKRRKIRRRAFRDAVRALRAPRTPRAAVCAAAVYNCARMLHDPRHLVMLISLAMSIVMLAGKLTAFWLTRSTAIFADAAESVVHGVATGLAAFALWYSGKPADERHPYGHGRIAYFSAGFEGALIFAAAITVIVSGVRMLIVGPELRQLAVGMSIAASLAAINLVLGLSLIRVGRRHNAMILVANGHHVLSDMWTTIASLGGVGLVYLTGITWLDPVTAILMGVYIMLTGFALLRGAVSGLMDEVDPELSHQIVACLRRSVAAGGIADFHQLRCRRTNDVLWIDVHMLVPGELSTLTAHERVTRVEESLRTAFPTFIVRVTTHIEPADHEAAHPGGHKSGDPLTPAEKF